jgi:hypothetical protein
MFIHKFDLINIYLNKNGEWGAALISLLNNNLFGIDGQLIIFNMKRDKTGMSTTVLHMLKMQIKAEANQLREIRQP